MKHKGKTLILVRHAHRDTSHRESDNGLSEKGLRQADQVVKDLNLHFADDLADPALVAVLSSPKKRCIETLEPLAKKLKKKVEISSWLDEQHSSESMGAMMKRIDQFIGWWKSEAPKITVICSHGDWLPVCANELTGTEINFEKGAWISVGLSASDQDEPEKITLHVHRTK